MHKFVLPRFVLSNSQSYSGTSSYWDKTWAYSIHWKGVHFELLVFFKCAPLWLLHLGITLKSKVSVDLDSKTYNDHLCKVIQHCGSYLMNQKWQLMHLLNLKIFN